VCTIEDGAEFIMRMMISACDDDDDSDVYNYNDEDDIGM
jgi:hypothetical protein